MATVTVQALQKLR